MRVIRSLVPFVALLFVVGCGEEAQDSTPTPSPSPGAVTWYGGVDKVIVERCSGCHVDAGIAPMPLSTYEEVAPYASLVAGYVSARLMPPGQPARGCQDIISSPLLEEEEIEMISTWAAAGAPEGDPTGAEEYGPRIDSLSLSRVDLTLKMPEPYTPTTEPDDYRCFLVDWPQDEPAYITGFGVTPGSPSVVHHIIGFIAQPETLRFYEDLDEADPGPGYTCFGGPGTIPVPVPPPWLGAWVPGQIGRDNPPDTGILIKPGSKIIIQMHYHVDETTRGVSDQSEVLLKVDTTVPHPAQIYPMANTEWIFGGAMVIPAGATNYPITYQKIWDSSTLLWDVGMHMHTLGQSGSVTVRHGDGSEECLVDIERFDFNWQYPYRLAEPIRIAAGDTVTLTCLYNNPRDVDVTWGDKTSDEMCLGVLYQTEDPDGP